MNEYGSDIGFTLQNTRKEKEWYWRMTVREVATTFTVL